MVANCLIQIEDQVDGSVKVVCTPGFEIVMKMIESGNMQDITPAHDYMMTAITAIRTLNNKAKKGDGESKIWVPRIGR